MKPNNQIQRQPRVLKAQYSGSFPLLIDFKMLPGEDARQASHRIDFERSGSHYPALLAFVECDKQNRPIPKWLTAFIAKGIAQHIDPKKGRSLDQSIGLKRREGQRRGDRDYIRWTTELHQISAIQHFRSQINPDTGSNYSIEDACKKLVEVGMGRGRKAKSLVTLWKTRRRDFGVK